MGEVPSAWLAALPMSVSVQAPLAALNLRADPSLSHAPHNLLVLCITWERAPIYSPCYTCFIHQPTHRWGISHPMEHCLQGRESLGQLLSLHGALTFFRASGDSSCSGPWCSPHWAGVLPSPAWDFKSTWFQHDSCLLDLRLLLPVSPELS